MQVTDTGGFPNQWGESQNASFKTHFSGEWIMASSSFIPSEDAAARDFTVNFATIIEANPAVYMLSGADAITISDAVNAFGW